MANTMLSKAILSWLLLLCVFSAAADTSVVVQRAWTTSLEYEYKTVAMLKSRYVIEYAAQADGKITDILSPGHKIAISDQLVQQSDPIKLLELEHAESVLLELIASRDLAKLQLGLHDAPAHRLKLRMAQAALEAQQIKLKQLRQALVLLSTQAVRPGVVVEQHTNVGEFVEKGDALLTTIDMSEVQYWLTLPLAQATQVNEHTRVVTLSGELSLPIAAVVPSGKTSVSLLTSVFDMSDRAIGHLASQPVIVKLRDDTPLQWFHRDSVIENNGVNQVKVINSQGRVVSRTIVIAAQKGQFVGVAGQLNSNEKIILRGMNGLKSSDQVSIDSDRTIELKKQFASIDEQNGKR